MNANKGTISNPSCLYLDEIVLRDGTGSSGVEREGRQPGAAEISSFEKISLGVGSIMDVKC